ncbi:methionyl-tRNA formyltransferase [Cupriavidus sp. HPC(L)]|uniref:methionyl-tRNA formyltransferase n=1 Tax=Cupriavidus sp. HPC(L) TaxID=1217418 RepID=UPI0002910BC9|nr:methionyl-tRNA formyltransferase [Cupriavidus sp. HPC(L)]ESJ25401.1 methionyl-tRNA formyltransferase [Cupriavidus sp. HPC(L)]
MTSPAPLRVAFAGTPEFARVALAAIVEAGFPVAAVLTQPDRPAGRGMQLQASPVKQHALAQGLGPILQPRSLRRHGKYPDEAVAAIDALAARTPDVMVVAAYGLILPAEVLTLPRHGCLNIHASLLPRWRGAAPIHRAIEAGDAQTGITLMQMDEGLDTGAMIAREAVPIGEDTTTGALHDTLAALGGRMIVQALRRLAADGTLPAEPQPDDGITYAEKIGKDEARLDLRRPAVELARQIRAFNPFPGASVQIGDAAIKCWQAEPLARAPEHADAAAGTVLAADANGVVIACGEDALRITELQKAGGRRLPAQAFLQGTLLPAGTRCVVLDGAA